MSGNYHFWYGPASKTQCIYPCQVHTEYIYLPNPLSMRQCTRLIRFLKKRKSPTEFNSRKFFFLRTVLLHLPSTPLSLSIKHAVIKCTTICQIGWKKHEWGSSIITSHKVTDNLVIHWRSTTVSRQTSMSDSNRLWFSLYVPFFFFFYFYTFL